MHKATTVDRLTLTRRVFGMDGPDRGPISMEFASVGANQAF